MKNYRIVEDAYAGYEAQVNYSFLPFIWFQMDAERSVNTWNTSEQAMEFIKQKKQGTYHKKATGKENFIFQCEMDVKRLLSSRLFKVKNHVNWQGRILQPAY